MKQRPLTWFPARGRVVGKSHSREGTTPTSTGLQISIIQNKSNKILKNLKFTNRPKTIQELQGRPSRIYKNSGNVSSPRATTTGNARKWVDLACFLLPFPSVLAVRTTRYLQKEKNTSKVFGSFSLFQIYSSLSSFFGSLFFPSSGGRSTCFFSPSILHWQWPAKQEKETHATTDFTFDLLSLQICSWSPPFQISFISVLSSSWSIWLLLFAATGGAVAAGFYRWRRVSRLGEERIEGVLADVEGNEGSWWWRWEAVAEGRRSWRRRWFRWEVLKRQRGKERKWESLWKMGERSAGFGSLSFFQKRGWGGG